MKPQIPFPVTTEMLEQARRATAGRHLCDYCLGRLFGKEGHGFTNGERGRAVRKAMEKNTPSQTKAGPAPVAQPPPGGNPEKTPENPKCWLCEVVTSQIEKYAKMAADEMAKWDYATFLIGTKIEPETAAREEELWTSSGAKKPETLKSEMNREIGKTVEKITGKRADFDLPDIVSIIDTRYDFVTLQVSSLYLYGRYKKLARGIPQTRWPCRLCEGKGCAHCGGKGKMYDTSVEEEIAHEAMAATGGTDHAFHGMGREDIDALMLGNGRPFILEIKNPKNRTVDLEGLQGKINAHAAGKASVTDLTVTGMRNVELIKNATHAKSYEITIKLPDYAGDMENLKKAIRIFGGAQLAQKTPQRVAHRRADLVRKRRVLEIEALAWDPREKTARLRIKAESGTYIKEFATGDCGGTKPSVSEALMTQVQVVELDVVRIHDEAGGAGEAKQE